ncbi:BON domain protein [Collimonas arenae]|uniref:BON domain protein n=1 Tax=Collimonas arenae TaxID=279058 RepID=A0A127PQ56_9BURK|nr:BON domain-containing protein [Collimonas arenae]AMO99521.1 BON domain protein [Collimonas arenae]AMP09421.1 BON domain protein [Collimonas arenae]
MNTFILGKAAIRNLLIVAAFGASLGAGTAIAASSDAAAAPQPHSDGVAATITDTAITGSVKARLMGNSHLKASDISVTTTNGVVTLSGTASSSRAKSLAGAQAKAVEGVKSVDNGLSVATSNKVQAKADMTVAKTERVVTDSWITTKVKSEILANSVTKGFDVSVKTTHGVVALSGTLANQDAIDHVKDIAAKVTGVKSVDTSAIVVASQ